MTSNSNSETDFATEFGKIAVPATGYYHIARGQAARPAPLLLGLHGYAQTAQDFVGVMRKIAPEEFVAAAAQGFNQIWTGPKSQISFAWLTAYEKEDSIVRNNDFINSLLDRLTGEGLVDPARVFLLGFSQGSSVAYRFAHRNPRRVAGLISVCSDLPPDIEANLAPLTDIPILILYGLKDKIFSVEKSEHAVRALTHGGIDVEAIPFDRGHIVPSSLAPEIRAWMRRVVAEGPRRAASKGAGVSSL